MKTITFLIVSVVSLMAQPQLALVGPSSVTPGATVAVNVTLNGSASNIAALQDTLTVSGASPSIAVAKAIAPSKSNTCAAFTCLVVGILPPPTSGPSGPLFAVNETFNSAAIPDSAAVQVITFSVPSSTAPGSTVTLALSGVIAADTSGNPVAISGSTATVTVISFAAAANNAFTAWVGTPSPANFQALILAIAAAQQAQN